VSQELERERVLAREAVEIKRAVTAAAAVALFASGTGVAAVKVMSGPHPLEVSPSIVPCDFGTGTQLEPSERGCLPDANPYTGDAGDAHPLAPRGARSGRSFVAAPTRRRILLVR
jgi:hypothetical protein